MLKFNVKELESEVRSYSRSYPSEFSTASNARIWDTKGRCYIDFLSGCGALNYGHNHIDCRNALLEYINMDGISMSLDMHSCAKTMFLESFYQYILCPRKLDYRLQFTGPTGANAVEAAIKLARKFTHRTNIIAFTNGFHGCSLGALSLTANMHHRASSQGLLNNVTRMPYEGYYGADIDTTFMIEKILDDRSGGIDKPAAFILETIQGEGGLNSVSKPWINRIFSIAKKHGILVIIDDIQAGCGRSGNFFSFEKFNVQPDIVILAKSISGFGLPMSLVLLKPELDIWEPAEHNGTFRGNNHAFVTAKAALNKFWSNNVFELELNQKISFLCDKLYCLAEQFNLSIKGRGFMQGIEFQNGKFSNKVKAICYANGLIIETSGATDQVLKILPPLTIDYNDLKDGLNIIKEAIYQSLEK